MNIASILDIDAICLWLCEEESTKTGGDAVSASIALQILQSTMMFSLLSDPDVRAGLTNMIATNSVHVGLDAINLRMATSKDEIALKYMDILGTEHSQLIDPPFAPIDSRLWQYRQWTVSHFNNLLITL
jgi:hypothetical protein